MTHADWPVCALGEVAQCDLGRMLDKSKNEGDPHPYLSNAAVRWGRFDLGHLGSIRVKAEDLGRYSVRAGDLVLCEGGEPGRCAVWNDSTPVVFQKALHRIRPSGEIDARFLQMYFRYASQCSWFHTFFTGTTIKHLPKQQLVRVPVPVPLLHEQRAIVAAIEDAFAQVDRVESELDAVERGHRQLVAAVLRDAFSGALTARRPKDGARSAELSTAGTGLPEGWRWSTIGGVCDKPQYGWTTKAASSGAVRFLRTTDLASGPVTWETVPFCEESPADADKYRLTSGDMLISRAGSIGFGVVLVAEPPEETVFASYLIRFRPDPAIVRPLLMRWFIQSPQYWQAIHASAVGVAMKNINAKKLSAVPLPVPPLDEQEGIVSTIEDVCAKADGLLDEVARTRGMLAALRSSVLHRAFTGELLDAPASEKAPAAP